MAHCEFVSVCVIKRIRLIWGESQYFIRLVDNSDARLLPIWNLFDLLFYLMLLSLKSEGYFWNDVGLWTLGSWPRVHDQMRKTILLFSRQFSAYFYNREISIYKISVLGCHLSRSKRKQRQTIENEGSQYWLFLIFNLKKRSKNVFEI